MSSKDKPDFVRSPQIEPPPKKERMTTDDVVTPQPEPKPTKERNPFSAGYGENLS